VLALGLLQKYCANKDSSVVRILGCGIQARASLAALVETMPLLSTVRCFDILPSSTKGFISQMKCEFPRLTFIECSAATEVARGSHIIATTTPI